MQREKFSDITVNIDVEKVIKSASFGCPLLVFPDTMSSGNMYLECNGYDDAVEKYMNAAMASTKTVPLTTPAAATEWSEEKGGAATFTKGSGSIYTNGNGALNDNGTLITYNGVSYNYLDCTENATITFDSSLFNRPMLKFGVAMLNDKGTASSEGYNSAYIKIMKNGKVMSSYNVTKEEPIIISERLSKAASGTTDTYTICWSKSVYIFGLAVYDLSVRVIDALETFYMQENSPEKIAMFLYGRSEVDVTEEDTAALFERDWRDMVYIGNVGEFIKYASRYAEIKDDKMIFILDDDTDDGIAAEFDGRDHTVVFYNNSDDTGKGAKTITALIAETAARDVGSFTYKNMPLTDVPSADVTAAELKALHNENINSYVTKCGVGVTSEGKTTSGEYIDIIDSKDWLILQIEYKLQQALINNPKVAYTNDGINYLASLVVDVLNKAWVNGMINTTDDGKGDYTVNFAPRSETTKEDRAARRYTGGKFSFNLAGAIHEAEVNGTILI